MVEFVAYIVTLVGYFGFFSTNDTLVPPNFFTSFKKDDGW
jgi:hypothetical protein